MTSPPATPEQPTLTEASPWRFHCHDELPCFTQCCRDVNIFLTPYDVLRLRWSLQLGSAEFLTRYTRYALAQTTNIPLVQLLMDPVTRRCPLVGDQGCGVYHDRPWACRMYPLDLTTTPGHYQLMVGKERCLGLIESDPSTVSEWLAGQGVAPYLDMETGFQEIMQAASKPGAPFAPPPGELIFLAYDLDRFAELLRDERFRRVYDIDDHLFEQAQDDDELLLRLAFRFIRDQIGESPPGS